MRSNKWQLVTKDGFEYARYFGQMYHCCTKDVYKSSSDILKSYVWIQAIQRYVSSKCCFSR